MSTRPDDVPVPDLPPRAIGGPAALAALSRPVRVAILNHLLAGGPRTASQCAVVTGESASNCSWHLRALAKVGLVERAPDVEGQDGRTRYWQAAAVGFDFGDQGDPAASVAASAFAAASTVHENELFARYQARRDVPEPWRQASGAASYGLALTADELEDVMGRVDALLRPYVRPIRGAVPAGGEIVHVTLRAFPDPDLLGPSEAAVGTPAGPAAGDDTVPGRS